MKEYYGGFCFDGKTFLYNPFSTVQFFKIKEFDNFWFDSGTSQQLVQLFKNKHLTVQQFRKAPVSRDMIFSPSQDIYTSPEIYLFQLGYLSLRPSEIKEKYILDYPNVEVRKSMALQVLEGYLESSDKAYDYCDDVLKALTDKDPPLLIDGLNRLFSAISYDYFDSGNQTEAFYSANIFLIFYALGLDVHPQEHVNKGRSVFAIHFEGETWVMEVKVNYHEISTENLSGNQTVSEEAIIKLAAKLYNEKLRANEKLANEIATNTEKAFVLMETLKELATEQLASEARQAAIWQSIADNTGITLLSGENLFEDLSNNKEETKEKRLSDEEKIAQKDKLLAKMLANDMKLAETIYTQILEQNYGDKYKNPILVSIVINDNLRSINAFKSNVIIPKKNEKNIKNDGKTNQSEDESRGPKPS
jgi:hypothetical protein